MQFLREYRLSIIPAIDWTYRDFRYGTPIFNAIESSVIAQTAFNEDIETPSKKGILITENHIDFTVNKSDTASTNPTSITVYNLSDETVSFLEGLAGSKGLCRLDAGYKGDLKQLVYGDITRVKDTFTNQDRLTQIFVNEGSKLLLDTFTSHTFPRGTKIDSAIDFLIKKIGLIKGSIFKSDAVLKTQFVVSGSAYQAIKVLSEVANYRMSVQDFTISISPKDLELNKKEEIDNFLSQHQEIIQITEDSGLIGFATIDEDNSGVSSQDDSQPKNSIKFDLLLNGAIKVGSFVRVFSKKVKPETVYRVVSVVHEGQYEGANWTSKCKAEKTGKIA